VRRISITARENLEAMMARHSVRPKPEVVAYALLLELIGALQMFVCGGTGEVLDAFVARHPGLRTLGPNFGTRIDLWYAARQGVRMTFATRLESKYGDLLACEWIIWGEGKEKLLWLRFSIGVKSVRII